MPNVVETGIFTRLPDRFRITGRLTEWHIRKQGGRALDCFLEGPSFDRAGNLYLVDIPFGRVFRVTPDGEFDLFAEYDGQPNGLKIHKDGRIFIADQKNGLVQIDPGTRQVTPVLRDLNGAALKGPNDLFFAASGNLYFTDQGETGLHDPTGRVCVLRPSGQCEILLGNLPGPNGIVVDAEERNVFVAVTRANCIWRIGLRGDGSVMRASIFIQLSGGLVGPDGLALGANESLLVAHAGRGTVWVFDRLGDLTHQIRSCAGLSTTNLAFHPDGQSLCIVESQYGVVLQAELSGLCGAAMYSHA